MTRRSRRTATRSILARRIILLLWIGLFVSGLLAASVWIRTRVATDELSWLMLQPSQFAARRCTLTFTGGEVCLDVRSAFALDRGVGFPPISRIPETDHFEIRDLRWKTSSPTRGFVMARPTFWSDVGFGLHVEPMFPYNASQGWYLSAFVGWAPMWLFLPLIAPLLTRSIRVFRRCWVDRLRRRRGLCPACGYDLRAASVRCPECGTPIHAESPKLRARGGAR
jgi:hypothetical protein